MSNPYLDNAFARPLPFRKRRPVIFWGGVLLLVLVAFSGIQSLRRGPLSGPKVGIIVVDGMILDSENTVAFADALLLDPKVKAVVVRINSPGGAVGASQEIYTAVKRLAEAKPVVVSMSSMAASGGYYIAVAGKEIFAMPSTLTAGIGVKLRVPNAEGLLHTLGLSAKTLTTGTLKDAGTFDRAMTPEEQAYLQGLIDDMFDEFVKTVAQNRHLPEDKVRAMADGRAMTGRQALQAGLVDKLGDFHDAVARAADLGGLPHGAPQLVEGPEKPYSLLRDFLGACMDAAAERAAATQQTQFFY